jgi:uncharacterized protein YrrD
LGNDRLGEFNRLEDEMQFKKGMNLISSDGKKIAQLERVVINPQDGAVSHLVVQKGFLMMQEKVLPVDMVQTTSANDIFLRINKEQLEQLPGFIDTEYVSLDEEDIVRHGYESEGDPLPLYWYPMTATAPLTWGGGYMGTVPGTTEFPYKITQEQNIPEGTIALKEGAKVVANDGKTVGNIARIVVGNEDERMTHLIISKGLLNQEKKLIPAHWINNVKEDKVELSVSSNLVDNLRNYEGEAK